MSALLFISDVCKGPRGERIQDEQSSILFSALFEQSSILFSALFEQSMSLFRAELAKVALIVQEEAYIVAMNLIVASSRLLQFTSKN